MTMDIRLLTCIIIRKNTKFLVGRVLGSSELRWSDSPHDAWRTRDKEAARDMARKTGGIMMLFNPAVGQLRVL